MGLMMFWETKMEGKQGKYNVKQLNDGNSHCLLLFLLPVLSLLVLLMVPVAPASFVMVVLVRKNI